MKKIMKDQAGVTLIETVAATAIIAIILVTVLGALLYGQKMVVFSDSKNNEAAQAQELIDKIMTQLSANTEPSLLSVGDVKKINGNFVDPKTIIEPEHPSDYRKQYIIEVDTVKRDVNGTAVDYTVYSIQVRVYYNNDESYVDLKAFAKKGGVWV